MPPLPTPFLFVPFLSFLALVSAPAAHADALTGRWDLIVYAPRGGRPEQVALWLTGDGELVNPNPRSAWDRAARPLLSIQCLGGRRVAFVNLNREADAEAVAVTTRLDGGPPHTAEWRLDSFGGVALVPPDAEAFVSGLLGGRVLEFTLPIAGAVPTATTFRVAGLDRALAPLRDRCGWR